MSQSNYANLIGIPYAQMNCWQICQKFYKQVFNLDLKDYFDPVFTDDKNYVCGLIRANEHEFVRVRAPEFGDLITIRIKGVECHIGIFLGKGLMLHTSKTTGSVIDRISRWNTMIAGYYSVKKDNRD